MLVLVVGPSGAGKDTLINAAKTALAGDGRFVFPRRVVTRPAVSALEDHESVSPEEFALQQANGAYALSWGAHGLQYGLPASIKDDIAAGSVVVMNGSRAMVGNARGAFPDTAVILVEASLEARAQRLAGRGRETAAQVAERLRREVDSDIPNAIRIDNSGDVTAGISRFVAALRALAAD